MLQTDAGTRSETLPKAGVGIVLLVSTMIVLMGLASDVVNGGDKWHQGDWLIHDLNGAVRRGAFGRWIILFSDALGLSPVWTAAFFQAVITISIPVLFWRISSAVGAWSATLLLISTPAMIFLFWAGDIQGALRKEIIGVLAVLFAGIGVARGQFVPAALGG
ncbi:hypothetical protein SAMN04488030_3146 [Aliiroseovarius halocynthiae]|uniref:Uncharacterized protein n=1 Tax=Aliiroseovarius halocynthiae TaxID=985055 RepID=A0A545SM51_9RHOB|nr:hypothetical protein [Aliiroseovarius halocynthiae]TQV66060.1 hypothetical protein FIL88_14920 [Aliiroseovarius halocynthiae]SMR83232.1 hypothetical protein SAMN04488030_3146 [Aliiroseovarius halocynthiae]